MEALELSASVFEKRKAPMPDLSNERIFPGGLHVKAIFQPECKWRLIEEFGADCFAEQEDGSLLFSADYTDKENLITWLMSFREKAILLEPKEVRDELVVSLKETLQQYGGI